MKKQRPIDDQYETNENKKYEITKPTTENDSENKQKQKIRKSARDKVSGKSSVPQRFFCG